MANRQVSTHKKRLMLKALEKSLSVVTTAVRSVGINRQTHYNWLKDDPKYAAEVKSIEDITLDFAESQLHKQIQDGNVTATIFLLKTKGKKRGYVERQEIQHDSSIESKLIEWTPSNQKE
jgi:hypothetical protein